MAGTVSALHAPGGLGHGFLLSVNSIVEGPSPVVSEIFEGDSFMFDFMLVAILFASVGVDDLRVVELGSSGEDVMDDLLRELSEAEAIESGADESTQHQNYI